MSPSESLYFAYGSNMDAPQMAERCPGARRLGTAILEGYRFLINSRGVASIAPVEGDRVHGLLWSVTDQDLGKLDVYEGVDDGWYRRETVDVAIGKESTRAVVYLAADNNAGPPRAGYLEKVVAGARAAGLPPDYLSQLEAMLGPPRAGRRS